MYVYIYIYIYIHIHMHIGNTHFLVYTVSSLVEQTTPNYLELFDAASSVSEVAFVDKDLDELELGGMIGWATPDYTARTTAYNVYLATDAAGADRSVIGGSVSIGTNNAPIMVETPLYTYSQIVVYTQSSLTEQTTPVALSISDTAALASAVEFPDFDLDLGDIGGTVNWAAAPDLSEVTQHMVYFATLSESCGTGCSASASNTTTTTTTDVAASLSNDTRLRVCRICVRAFFGSVAANATSITVPVNTPLANYSVDGLAPTHVLVYASSDLVESSTPAAVALYDASADVSNVNFTDKDLDRLELGGVIITSTITIIIIIISIVCYIYIYICITNLSHSLSISISLSLSIYLSLSLYIYIYIMYIYIYIFMCIYIYIYIHTYIHI